MLHSLTPEDIGPRIDAVIREDAELAVYAVASREYFCLVATMMDEEENQSPYWKGQESFDSSELLFHSDGFEESVPSQDRFYSVRSTSGLAPMLYYETLMWPAVSTYRDNTDALGAVVFACDPSGRPFRTDIFVVPMREVRCSESPTFHFCYYGRSSFGHAWYSGICVCMPEDYSSFDIPASYFCSLDLSPLESNRE